MSTIRFQMINDLPQCPSTTLEFDDTDAPFIEDIMAAFEQFLLGMTFHPSTIKKYLDVDGIQKALLGRAQQVAALSRE
jgi:hypothetical protein